MDRRTLRNNPLKLLGLPMRTLMEKEVHAMDWVCERLGREPDTVLVDAKYEKLIDGSPEVADFCKTYGNSCDRCPLVGDACRWKRGRLTTGMKAAELMARIKSIKRTAIEKAKALDSDS